MPVKVRCPGCRKVLNAPDKARGRTLKCPGCQGPIKVPTGQRKPSAPAKKKRPRRSRHDDDFLSGVNLDRLEDRSANVCPKCGANVFEDDEVCGECGIDLETGKVREKRKGPDPSKFYGEAWSNSWAFLVANKKLAFFTGMVWTLFVVLNVGMIAATISSFGWERKQAETAIKEERAKERERQQGQPQQDDDEVAEVNGLSVEDEAWWRAMRSPLVVVCGFIAVLTALGPPGWYWFVSAKVIEQTMQKKKLLEMRKVQFDIFNTVIFGFKGFFWPWVVLSPILIPLSFALIPMLILGAVAFGAFGLVGVAMIVVGIFLLPMFAFPIAQVHMTMPYTYPAFLPWDMLKTFFRNIGPSLYWLMMAIVVTLPFTVPATVLALLYGGEIRESADENLSSLVAWAVETMGGDPASRGFAYGATKFGIFATLLFLVSSIIMIPMAFAGLFLMRANGLLGFYNRRTLDLVTRHKPNVPCGFWVRYLAMLIDRFLLVLIMLVVSVVYVVGAFMLSGMGISYFLLLAPAVLSFLSFLITMAYYVKSESGIFQGTLGKRALGIIVTDLNDRQINTKQAMGRFFSRVLLSESFFGVGYILAGFTEQKQALHDITAKTLVVWEARDDR